MPTIYQIVIIALVVTFVMVLTDKTEVRYKLRDWCDMHHVSVAAKMLDCDFCYSFWLAVAFTIVFTFVTSDVSWLLVPFLSTPLVRILY